MASFASLSLNAYRPDFHFVGGCENDGAANILGLEEIPRVRHFDVEGNCLGVGALAKHFGQRKKQRHDRKEERDMLVLARRMPGAFKLLQLFVGFTHGSPSISHRFAGKIGWNCAMLRPAQPSWPERLPAVESIASPQR
jgi:hypothetical protein